MSAVVIVWAWVFKTVSYAAIHLRGFQQIDSKKSREIFKYVSGRFDDSMVVSLQLNRDYVSEGYRPESTAPLNVLLVSFMCVITKQ